MDQRYDVFISYRHGDRDQALLLKRSLEHHYHTYLDFEANLDRNLTGRDFEPEIRKALMECRFSFVVISKTWIDSVGDLFDEQNHSRKEIETLLGRAEENIPVIPAVWGELDPDKNDLPESLRPLLDKDYMRLTARTLDREMW